MVIFTKKLYNLNGGKALYMESKSNTERLKKQGYWKFRGWYALRIEK